jgi:hypothetical protein
MAKHTSRVPVCWTALYDALTAATWPAHPTTGRTPVPDYGGDQNVLDEAVIVPGSAPPGGASQEWRTMGDVTKEEVFRLVIVMWTRVPGRTAVQAKERIEALEAVAEAALRDQTTGLPKGISEAGVRVWSVADVEFAVGPDTEGFSASCRMEIQFTCRI